MIKIENGNVHIKAVSINDIIDDLKAFMGFIRYDENYIDFCKSIEFDIPAELDGKLKMFIEEITANKGE